MTVAKTKCHVVRKIGKSVWDGCQYALLGQGREVVDVRNLAVSRMYLLKTIVLELSVIHVLCID
jgi:hypothetical protein